MQVAQMEREFLTIQKSHAAGLVRDALAESKSLGELAAILRSEKLFPLVSDLKICDVLNARSFAKLTRNQVRKKNVHVPDYRKTAIKKLLLKNLSVKDCDTTELEWSINNKFENLPAGFTYKMLHELEIAKNVHRVANGVPIIWGVGTP